MKKILFVVCICLFWFPLISFGAETKTVTFMWDISSDPNVAGYNIYKSIESGNYNNPDNTELITSNTYDVIITLPFTETLYFTVTATNGILESDFSNEVILSKPPVPSHLDMKLEINISNSTVTINN